MTVTEIKKRIVEVIHSNFDVVNFDPEKPISDTIYNAKGMVELRNLLSVVFSDKDRAIKLNHNDIQDDMNLDYMAKAIEIKLQ